MQTRNLARVTSTPAKKWMSVDAQKKLRRLQGFSKPGCVIARFSRTWLGDHKIFPDKVIARFSPDKVRLQSSRTRLWLQVFSRQDYVIVFFYLNTTVYVFRASPRPHILVFFPNSFFCLCQFNCQRGTQAFSPQLPIWVFLTFADAHSRTLHPIDLSNVKANTQRIVTFGGQWNASSSLKNFHSTKALFRELLRLSANPPTPPIMPEEVTLVKETALSWPPILMD